MSKAVLDSLKIDEVTLEAGKQYTDGAGEQRLCRLLTSEGTGNYVIYTTPDSTSPQKVAAQDFVTWLGNTDASPRATHRHSADQKAAMSTPHKDPGYRIDTKLGQLFFNEGSSERIVGDIDLAIAYCADQDHPYLVRHGTAAKVVAYADKMKAVDPDIQCVTIPWEVLKHPVVGPQVVHEVNACLANSGRVGQLVERLVSITEGADIQLFPRFDKEPSVPSNGMR